LESTRVPYNVAKFHELWSTNGLKLDQIFTHPQYSVPSPVGIARHCWCQKNRASDCPFVWYQNVRSALFGFVKNACDRQMDKLGQTDRLFITTSKTALYYSCVAR